MHGERERERESLLLLPDRSAGAMEGGGEHHHPLSVFLRDARLAFRWDELGQEIMRIAVPGALALMADPVASLVDTAFIGHIGPVELGAVGVSIAVFNQVSRIAVFPLVSVTTSFVAEEDAMSNGRDNDKIHQQNERNVSVSEMDELIPPEGASASTSISSFETDSCEVSVEQKRKNIPSVSTALLLGGVLGLLETLLLVLSAKPILGYMGVKPDSAMMKPALQYLVLRSLGAPAVLLSLAIQGVFRGFKDTKTPLYATVAGDAINIVLDPIFMFVFQYGVSGAAIAHVISQYFIASILLWRLRLHVDLLPPSFKHLQFGRFLKNGFLLLARVIAATCCVTLSASMAARLGSTPMAAFQICLQTWLACSLLADGLAFAGQAILASAFARKDYPKATATASRILQLALVLGLLLSILLGVGLRIGSRLFTSDQGVLHHIYIGIPAHIISFIHIISACKPFRESLSALLNQSTLWLLFLMVSITEHQISDMLPTQWQADRLLLVTHILLINLVPYNFFTEPCMYRQVLVAVVSIICILTLESYGGFIGIWIALVIYMSLRMFAGFWRIGTAQGPWAYLRG
ncbi:multidrug and toxic compound extrusion1 [Zea mays]|uniref:Protein DETOXIFICATION n=1 Tax=Zea mays TaxID=4577 RepID=A0A1D6LEK4_MAIZE|nr:multidrug and toxic compound extrusion1 [Zea mays]